MAAIPVGLRTDAVLRRVRGVSAGDPALPGTSRRVTARLTQGQLAWVSDNSAERRTTRLGEGQLGRGRDNSAGKVSSSRIETGASLRHARDARRLFRFHIPVRTAVRLDHCQGSA